MPFPAAAVLARVRSGVALMPAVIECGATRAEYAAHRLADMEWARAIDDALLGEEQERRERAAYIEEHAQAMLDAIAGGMTDGKAAEMHGIRRQDWWAWKQEPRNRAAYGAAQMARADSIFEVGLTEATTSGEPKLAWSARVEYLKRTLPAVYGDRQTLAVEAKREPTPAERAIDQMTDEECLALIEQVRKNDSH